MNTGFLSIFSKQNKIKINFNKDIEIKNKRQDFHNIILIKE